MHVSSVPSFTLSLIFSYHYLLILFILHFVSNLHLHRTALSRPSLFLSLHGLSNPQRHPAPSTLKPERFFLSKAALVTIYQWPLVPPGLSSDSLSIQGPLFNCCCGLVF